MNEEHSYISFTLHQKRCLYFSFLQSSFLFSASSLLETEQGPLLSSMELLRHLLWWLNLSSCILCKKLNPSSQEVSRFLGRCTLAYQFHFSLHQPSLSLSNSSLTLPLRAQPSLSGRCPFFRMLLLGILIPIFHVSSLVSLVEIKHQLTTLWKRAPRKISFLRAFSGHVFTLNFVGSLWPISISPISIAKNCCFFSKRCYSGVGLFL